LFLVAYQLILTTTQSTENTVECELVEEKRWEGSSVRMMTCFMTDQASINSIGFTISTPRDENVKGLSFDTNRNIFYLPENVNATFPNLVIYNAQCCSLTSISYKNFAGLNKIMELYLDENLIQIVDKLKHLKNRFPFTLSLTKKKKIIL
jgi:hypothetical protein